VCHSWKCYTVAFMSIRILRTDCMNATQKLIILKLRPCLCHAVTFVWVRIWVHSLSWVDSTEWRSYNRHLVLLMLYKLISSLLAACIVLELNDDDDYTTCYSPIRSLWFCSDGVARLYLIELIVWMGWCSNAFLSNDVSVTTEDMKLEICT